MQENKNAALSQAWAEAFVTRLVNSGIRDVCCSPGFRNSALLLALHNQKEIKTHTIIDERASAFFALGLAKATQRPTAVVCTSGTAAGNFFPALLEAYHSYIPLICITADRAFEDIGVGANQSMNQTELYGRYVRFFAPLPLPEEAPVAWQNMHYLTAKAVHLAQSPVSGPVHINICFREPFFTTNGIPANYVSPDIHFEATNFNPSPRQTNLVLQLLQKFPRSIIAVGPGNYLESFIAGISQLAHTLKLPLFSEPGQGIGLFDQFLRSENIVKQAQPDLVLRFGAPLVSKQFKKYYESNPQCVHIIFDELGEMRNPSYGDAHYFHGSPIAWLNALLEKASDLKLRNPEWLQYFSEKEQKTKLLLQKHLEKTKAFTEWHFMNALPTLLPEKSFLFLGNSMPIRDFHSVVDSIGKAITVYSNRGLSGIDGIMATASGVSASSPRILTTLVIGDLSFVHDLNTLITAKQQNLNLLILVINNNGGEIFRLLPTGKKEVETVFTTPQDIHIVELAKAAGLASDSAHSVEEFKEKFLSFKKLAGIKVLEIKIDVIHNTEIRQQFWQEIKSLT